ncbi:PREDICTED: endoplasmic reticulum resident protein 44-like isoform X2 [Priapulus caudatus]|uniref:Endoplasmic reticulum resident protein 44-like isoform X2 n=1 Tax=Priapulus caudatus TaxID=37621 RepID=A0ABM1DUT8_PRICU|nr:PREDICTED: endoplasmic reticulum resident protein 44-like isoform X2 [Priapulus caudatus]XP_014663719.1 PREDICTED: endoplasmic reticulum resident protein 44-like isoform X2 [Priapulus caudatus]
MVAINSVCVEFIHIIFIIILSVLYIPATSQPVSLTVNNFDQVVKNTEIVFINFYADWCRFSQILNPIFEEADKKLRTDVPDAEGKVIFGKVNCDEQVQVCTRHHISKYPTLKLFRNGNMAKREYRGQRSVDALANHIKDQVADQVVEFKDVDDLDDLSIKKRNIVGFFNVKESNTYAVFARVASILRDDCTFHAGFGEVTRKERTGGDNIIFRPPHNKPDMVYIGPLTNFDLLYAWTADKCNPLVREISFENAEELTEEGLPFLILFHDPSDTKIVEEYTKIVSSELLMEKNSINFVTADGLKFSHPLHHLGKASKDLPLIAIDSFRHMYMFPDIKDMTAPGKLKQYVADLHSGKLHREFHHGPEKQASHDKTAPTAADRTDPPESTFRKLAPSRNRYTLLRDEL